MKLSCALLVACMTTAAQAQQPGWLGMPPDQYDKPYEGRLIINPVETKEDEQQLRETCRNAEVPLACAVVWSKTLCEIMMMPDEVLRAAGWDPAIVRRHEMAHCNGWPADHKGGRALSGPNKNVGPSFTIELNSVENAGTRCRVNFVIENKSNVAMKNMKLDVVAFSADAAILRRLLIEMGPVRAAKTMVRTCVFDDECRQIGSVLVNGVELCTR